MSTQAPAEHDRLAATNDGEDARSEKPGRSKKPKDPSAVRPWVIVLLSVVGGLLALLWLSPFWFIVVNSFKTYGNIIADAAGFPDPPTTDNYPFAWESANFVSAIFNSVIITVLSVGSMIVIGALAAWRMARMPHRINKLIFFVFVSAMIVPFQTIMIPIVKITSDLNLLNTRPGLIMVYIGLGMPLTVFFLHGFVTSSVPLSLEEAARIDGASPWQTFRYIVLPHLTPFMQLCVLFGVIYILAEFDSIAMTTQGGPGDLTMNLPFLIYRTVFFSFDVGRGSAMGVVLVVITIIFATMLIRLMGRIMEGSTK